MRVFRISSERFAGDLSGKGAEIAGGRWNSKGTAVVYTSESRALSMAEVAVHLPMSIVPPNFKIIEIEIPDSVEIQEIEAGTLPPDWNKFPYLKATQLVGDTFIRSRNYAVLKVPSAVVLGDFNLLINPAYIEKTGIKILNVKDFKFDDRFFGRD